MKKFMEKLYLFFVNVYVNSFNKEIEESKNLALEAIRNILGLLNFYLLILIFVFSNTCVFKFDKSIIKTEYVFIFLLVYMTLYVLYFIKFLKKRLIVINVDYLPYIKNKNLIFYGIVASVSILSFLFYVVGILIPHNIC